MSLNNKKSTEAQFTTIESIRNGVCSSNKLIHPVVNAQERVVACYQIILKKDSFQAQNILGSNLTSKYMILKIMNQISYSIILKKYAELEAKKYKYELLASMKFTSEIWACRSLKQLFIQITEFLPDFLGFKSAGILLLDEATSELYTIPIYKDEKSGNAISSIIRFPLQLGVSGIVFETCKIYTCNEAKTDRKYVSDVDNLNSLQDLSNFMICPIFSKTNSAKSTGVIQLLNKKLGQRINRFDIEKFECIQELIGMCFENTTDIDSSINIAIGKAPIYF